MNTFPTTLALQQRIKRRKTLAAAAAAMGVASVAGCNLMSPQAAPAPAPAAAAAGQTMTDDMVQNYTSDIEKALDNIDRKRLSLARQAGQTPAAGGGYDVAKVTPVKATSAQASVSDEKSPKPSAETASKVETIQTAAIVPDPTPAAAPASSLSMGLPIPEPTAAPATPAIAAEPAPSLEPAALSPTSAKTTVETLPALQPATTYETVGTPPHGPSSVSPMFGVVLAAPAEPASSVVAAASLTPSATPAAAMGSMTAMLAPAPSPTATVATPEPAAEPTVDDAMAILRKSISAHPTLNTALALALLEGKSTDDITKSLSDPDQKLLADLTAALDSMKTAAPAAPLAKRAAPILDAAKQWQADADLALPRLVLASRVDSYGVFSAVEPVFEQGKKHTVIIYCEVGNFGSKKGDDGWYTTRLTQQESLITEDKLLVWRPNPEEVEDRSMNQRHDFYLVKKLTLPETLAAGKYTLRMDVTDVTTGKRSLQSMDIQLVTK